MYIEDGCFICRVLLYLTREEKLEVADTLNTALNSTRMMMKLPI